MQDARLRVALGRALFGDWLLIKPAHRTCVQLVMEYAQDRKGARVAIPLPPSCLDETGETPHHLALRNEQLLAEDISCVLPPWLFLSGLQGVRAQALHVKCIISVGFMLSEWDRSHHSDDTIYHAFRLDDAPDEPLASVLNHVLPILHDNERKGIKTLVHCQMGMSRSVSCVIAFLMSRLWRTIAPLINSYHRTPTSMLRTTLQPYLYAFAHDSVKRARDFILPNPGFRRCLITDVESWSLE